MFLVVWYGLVRLGWVNLSELCWAGLHWVSLVGFSYFTLSWAELGSVKLLFGLFHHYFTFL